MSMSIRVKKAFMVGILLSLTLWLSFMVSINAQEFIVLENDAGVQKSSFLRGEGIVVTVMLPFDADVTVLLHNPPGAPGPSPTTFIPTTPVSANIQTKLGPKWLDERAPCGKYQLEIRILRQGVLQKTEYKYFDYAINEPPCYIPTITTTTREGEGGLILLAVSIGGIVAVAAVLAAFFMLRQRAPPPKERVVTPPPVTPPSPMPPSAPPKPSHRRVPVVRAERREEE